MRYIFDLDHTVIDSSHRQLTKADGSLDLDHWIANNTRAKIMADSLLPLATQWRKAYAKGSEIVVCTARVIGQDDRDFLAMNGLRYHAMLSRPKARPPRTIFSNWWHFANMLRKSGDLGRTFARLPSCGMTTKMCKKRLQLAD